MNDRFADEIDRASALEEENRKRMIDAARNAVKSANSLSYCGFCYFCGEEVRNPKIFCDKECADSYERMQAARRRIGM